MSDLFNIGASGVRAYQSALTVVSENIANTGTAGYARRSVDLSEVGATGGTVAQRIGIDGIDGNGVRATGVTSSADALRAADVRVAGSDLARSETGVEWLDRIDSALTGTQLGDRLTGFFTSASAVAADPTASAPRSAMLEAGISVADAFTATGSALDRVASDLDATADGAVSSLNALGAALAQVNAGLGRTAPGTSAAAQLGDQRDQLLEQMSALSDVSVSTDAIGRATVRIGGAAGPIFVAGSDAGALTYVRGGDGSVSFELHRDGAAAAVTPGGGALAGVADGAQRLAGARDQLDGVASDFTNGVNAFQAQGRTLDATPGAAMFATGGSPTDVTMTLTDPRGIAAAAVGGGTRDNANLAALADLRNSGGYETRTTALVAGNAAALAARQQVSAAQSSIRDGAVAARDSVSGVSLDAEAVDLMRFQQAYQASSRIIQVARDTFQSIIDIH